MTKGFNHGPIAQNAYVVADLDAGIDQWGRTMNIGPLGKFTDIRFQTADYRGRDVPVQFEAAIAYSGGLQIELIKPLGPSIFQEWLDDGRTGVHHVMVMAENMAAAEAEVLARGGRRVQGGVLIDGSTIGYYEMEGGPGPLFEIARLNRGFFDVFERLERAAAQWDGKTRVLEY